MRSVAIHRSVFDEIGNFEHGGEGVDFSTPCTTAGIEIGQVPDVVLHYRHRATLRGGQWIRITASTPAS